jgi:membrane protease YdiL (CAAX protease family)
MATEEVGIKRELARRRVFVFASAFFAIALFAVINEEADMFLHALDDYAIVILSLVVLILIAAWRKKVTFSELRKQHNIITALFVIMLLFQLYAIPTEIGDPSDFGNEIPVLVGLVLALLNRFL